VLFPSLCEGLLTVIISLLLDEREVHHRSAKAMPEDRTPEKKSVPLDATSVSAVTVFSDRAEVTRLVTLDLPGGLYEVTIQGLTSKADEDSVRVKSAPGSRRSTLLEVSHEVHTKHVDAAADAASAVDAKRKELKDLQTVLAETADELAREMATKAMIDTYVTGMLTPTKEAAPPVGHKLDSVRELLTFHAKAAAEHGANRLRIEAAMAAIHAKIEAVEAALQRLAAPYRLRTQTSRDVQILVQVGDQLPLPFLT